MSAQESVFGQVSRLCFPASERAGLMLMLAAYFDDSGTHDDSKIMVWGGFIGTATQWADFDKAWRAKLAAPIPGKPRLKKFSLADCNARRGEFLGYSQAESDLLQNECRELIVQAGVIGLSFAVEREPWDRLIQGPARADLGDVETACFSGCFNGAIECAVQHYPNDLMLSIHFDRGRKSPKLDAIIDHVTKVYRGAPALVNLSFNPVVDFTPLQAADIIATENYWQARSIVEGAEHVRPHFKHFLSKIQRTNGYIAQEAEIVDTLKRRGFTSSAA